MTAADVSSDQTKRRPGKRLVKQVRELGLPAPFELERFHDWLERHSQRRIRMIAAALPAGGPSGALIRRPAADYLYYEEQTSPFHRAHIVLCLAAHIVLGQGSPAPVDMRLMPDVSPQLVRRMLGASRDGVISSLQAEAFAYLALGRPGPRWLPLAAWRDLRRLGPLTAGLARTVREENEGTRRWGRLPGRFRLYRRVIGIRDAMLTLTPYRDARVADEAMAGGQAAGLAGDDLTAAIEAAVLKAAARQKGTGVLPHRPDVSVRGPSGLDADLRSETAWLVLVSGAWARTSSVTLRPEPSCSGTTSSM
ncbi:MAG TPA: DUF6545 domain-containing protein [Streptosporangiaceae bacterium]|jgi:hypothetical protein